MPITQVDAKVDQKHDLSSPYEGRDAEFWQRYDPEKWHGLPVGLGLVGRRLEDEEVS